MVLSDDESFIVNVVEEQNINLELTDIKNELNKFLFHYSKSFKRHLISGVKTLRRTLDSILRDRCALNSQILIRISAELNTYFESLDYELEITELAGGEDSFTSETREYLLRLIEKYISTIYYGQLFQIVEIESFENGEERLEEMIDKYYWISVKHLDLKLNEEDEDVRLFIYTAIRNLILITSVKSSYQKLNCVNQFCKFVMQSMHQSKEGEEERQSGFQSISADDFLPTLIYAILKAKVPHLLTHIYFIKSFISLRRDLENGEVAYNFTTFNAALDFIQGLDNSNFQNSITKTSGDEVDACPKYFNNSVNVIHDEVRLMNLKRRGDILRSLRDKITESQKLIKTQLNDIKEKKCWNVIKWIPIVNVGYGGVRSICYKVKGNNDEALNSIVGAVGGLAGVGAGIAATAISGPVIVPIVAGLICSGSANQAVTGGGELIIESKDNPDLFKKLSPDGKEKKIYVKMIKDAPVVGMFYSSVRSTIYWAKGNKKEAKTSATNAAVNGGASSIGILAGVGMARLSTQLTTAAASAAVDASDDVVRPMSTEIIEFVTAQAARVAASPAASVACNVGANSLSRYIIEEKILHESDDLLF